MQLGGEKKSIKKIPCDHLPLSSCYYSGYLIRVMVRPPCQRPRQFIAVGQERGPRRKRRSCDRNKKSDRPKLPVASHGDGSHAEPHCNDKMARKKGRGQLNSVRTTSSCKARARVYTFLSHVLKMDRAPSSIHRRIMRTVSFVADV